MPDRQRFGHIHHDIRHADVQPSRGLAGSALDAMFIELSHLLETHRSPTEPLNKVYSSEVWYYYDVEINQC